MHIHPQLVSFIAPSRFRKISFSQTLPSFPEGLPTIGKASRRFKHTTLRTTRIQKKVETEKHIVRWLRFLSLVSFSLFSSLVSPMHVFPIPRDSVSSYMDETKAAIDSCDSYVSSDSNGSDMEPPSVFTVEGGSN